MVNLDAGLGPVITEGKLGPSCDANANANDAKQRVTAMRIVRLD